jgi:hypothetical protein
LFNRSIPNIGKKLVLNGVVESLWETWWERS